MVKRMIIFKSRFLKILLFAFILNTLWEFGQCVFFYNMWSWLFWKSTLWMWAAIFGDVIIVLGLWKGAHLLYGQQQFHKPSPAGYLVLLMLSFFASIVFEWLAIYLDLWSYDSFMPTIQVLERNIGLLPVFQITLLPALAVYLASKYSK